MKPTQTHTPNYSVRRLPDVYLVIQAARTVRITKHKFGSRTYYKAPESGYMRTLRDAVMYVATGGLVF